VWGRPASGSSGRSGARRSGAASLAEVEREVAATVGRAAAGALSSGAAELTTTTVVERHGGDASYDAPVVVLTPRNPRAAAVVVEVQDPELWMLSAGDGPPYEFYTGMSGDWHELLHDLAEAAVAGRYRIERREEWLRLLLRPWRRRRLEGTAAVFETARGVEATTHFGGASFGAPREFEPY
jgi:hypothetical protein